MAKPKRIGLIKKGQPLLGRKGFKFESAHLTEREAEKAEDKLVDNPRVQDISRVTVPRQHLIFSKKSKRITPQTPRLRR